jgi:phenol hydroxylase P1 protein
MQIDIKTSSVSQVRNTFTNVAQRIGGDKPASRYQEASMDLQPTTNFHYRPLWDAKHHVYDQRRTAIVMKDWYVVRDPRQYYYGTYTIARSRQQETMEKNIEFVQKRGLLQELPADAREAIIMALVPLRHVEWAANTNNCYVTSYGWGSMLTQATMFHTMDRLGLAQYFSRIGLLVDGNTGSSLTAGKTLWMEHSAWQGLRRLVERSMTVSDWFETFVVQNLVIDGLLHPLVLGQYEKRSGAALSLLFEFMTAWSDETVRWVDAVVKVVVAESPENAKQIGQWISEWMASTLDALQPYAREVFGADDEAALSAASSALSTRLGKLGITV